MIYSDRGIAASPVLIRLPTITSLLMFLMLLSGVARGGSLEVGTSIPRHDPALMLQETTGQLLAVSIEARAYASNDRERYYESVSRILDQVVDISYFARSVMANHASTRLYQSLQTDADRQAFRDRLERFEIAMQRVLMARYADALLGFAGERITLGQAMYSTDDPNRASIEQTIQAADGTTYLVQYSLYRNQDGTWSIRNVIVEDVNLGQIYRSQFAEAVENHRGDVDFVVEHWVELMSGREHNP